MNNIKPFCGYTYNSEKFSELTKVIAPPYDIITKEMNLQLRGNSEYNIVHLTNDFGQNNEFYSKSAEKWNSLIDENVIHKIKKPAIWRIKETFVSPEQTKLTRTGFITLIKPQPYSKKVVLPHERTHSGPKIDRLKLMETTSANYSPIFFIYKEYENDFVHYNNSFPEDFVTNAKLDIGGNVELSISFTTDLKWINSFTELMNTKTVLIADGHHRYETSLFFLNKNQEKFKSANSAIMGYFVPSCSEGMVIYPTHRGIYNLENFNFESLLENCKSFFSIEKQNKNKLINKSDSSFLIMDQKLDYYCLIPKPEALSSLTDEVNSSELASLDVILLEKLIFKSILGFSDEDIKKKKYLKYYHSKEKYEIELQNNHLQCVFLMNSIPLDTLFSIAKQGHVLPQKSTYFYPKCTVGLVMHSFEEK